MDARFALILAIGTMLFSQSVQGGTPSSSDLFFSEYVEGTSNNKAVEIYNASPLPIDLAASSCQVLIYANGSATPTSTINLIGTIAAGDVFVLANSAASFVFIADQASGSLTFNGDDAVVLRAGAQVLDVIGQIGVDPGVQWGNVVLGTLDQTLRRIPSVCQGDANGANVFDPSVEWASFAIDTFDGLGAHTANCQNTCLADIAPPGGNGVVDIDDLVLVITSWSATSGPADINSNGIVDIDDLVAVITAWGPCP